jgi:hypothetical protein
MGQQDVYNFLRAHPNDWFTSKEIRNDIKYKPTGLRKGKRAQYLYKFKI